MLSTTLDAIRNGDVEEIENEGKREEYAGLAAWMLHDQIKEVEGMLDKMIYGKGRETDKIVKIKG